MTHPRKRISTCGVTSHPQSVLEPSALEPPPQLHQLRPFPNGPFQRFLPLCIRRAKLRTTLKSTPLLLPSPKLHQPRHLFTPIAPTSMARSAQWRQSLSPTTHTPPIAKIGRVGPPRLETTMLLKTCSAPRRSRRSLIWMHRKRHPFAFTIWCEGWSVKSSTSRRWDPRFAVNIRSWPIFDPAISWASQAGDFSDIRSCGIQ